MEPAPYWFHFFRQTPPFEIRGIPFTERILLPHKRRGGVGVPNAKKEAPKFQVGYGAGYRKSEILGQKEEVYKRRTSIR